MGKVSRSEILNRIITLQSTYFNRYLSVPDDSDTIFIRDHNNADELLHAVGTRFIVQEGPDDTILLESLRYRHYYLDPRKFPTPKVAHLTPSHPPPRDSTWAQWRLHNVSGEDVVALESNLKPGEYIGVIHITHDFASALLKGNVYLPFMGRSDLSNPIIQWTLRIGAGQGIVDWYKDLGHFENPGYRSVQRDFTYTAGSSATSDGTYRYTGHPKLTDSLFYEMSVNFSVGPLYINDRTRVSNSSAWSTTDPQAWQEEKTVTTSIEVPAKTKLMVIQLQGYYGPFYIQSKDLQTIKE